jgi:hypothetical protein
MNLIHTKISKENFIDLFEIIHQDIITERKSRNFTFIRPCKCANIDVKMFLKIQVHYEFGVENTLIQTLKLSLNSESMALRKHTSSYFNDNDGIKMVHEININEPHGYGEIVDKIIDNLNIFRVCPCCRILYKSKCPTSIQDACFHCHFDSIFFPQDITCAICRDVIVEQEQTFALTCSHVFHTCCIMKNFLISQNKFCPICKEVDDSKV